MRTFSIGRKLCFLLFLFLFQFSRVFARDINLDEIYINNKQGNLARLLSLKHKAYQILKSTPVDDNVIYSGWVSGNRLVYVKEYMNAGTNEIYEYYPASRIRKRIASIRGAIVHTKCALNGKCLYLKMIHLRGNSISGEIVAINLHNNAITRKRSTDPLLDFTISYHGDFLYYENAEGIIEFSPDDGYERLFLHEQKYRSGMSRNNATLALVSPLKNKVLLVNGSGGTYSAIVIDGNRERVLDGITSVSELWWLDNSRVVFRGGGLANYQMIVFDTDTGRQYIKSEKSLNTNISFSPFDRYLVYNLDGLISFYFHRFETTIVYPLEGEDVFFSPDGASFVSLYQKRLYLSRYSSLQDNQIELKRNAAEILSLYRRIQLSKENLLNDYSDDYIDRKISIYEKVSR